MGRTERLRRLLQIAGEFGLDLGDEAEATQDLEELFAWLRLCLEEQRTDAVRGYDEFEAELGDLELEMMENGNDHT